MPPPLRLETVGLVRVGGPRGPVASGVFPCRVGGGCHHVASPFFFSAPFFFFFKSILFRGGARAAAEKRDTPARSQGFRTEGKEPRGVVVSLPTLGGHFSRANPNSPVTSACPQATTRPDLRPTSGVGCVESLRLPPPISTPLGLGGSPPAPAPFGLAWDRVLAPPPPP